MQFLGRLLTVLLEDPFAGMHAASLSAVACNTSCFRVFVCDSVIACGIMMSMHACALEVPVLRQLQLCRFYCELGMISAVHCMFSLHYS